MSILTTELRRIAHRRITKVAAIAGVGIVALVAGATFFTHDGAPPDLAAAESTAALNQADCMQYNDWGDMTESEIADSCYQDPAWYQTDKNFHMQSLLLSSYDSGSQPWDTAKISIDRSPNGVVDSSYLADGVVAPDTNPARGYGGVLSGFGMAIFLAAALLGSSYIGADWRSKSIETQLTWQPNRRRLLAGKIGAVAFAATAYAVTMSGLLVAAIVPSALWRGDFHGTGPGFWIDVALTVGRIAIAAAVVATLAAAVTTTFRNTVAGVATVFLLGAVGLMVGALADGPLSGADLFRNVGAWIAHGDVWKSVQLNGKDGGISYFEVPIHGWWVAGLVVVGYAAVASAIGGLSFARRDIS